MVKRVLKDGWKIDQARKEAETIGLNSPAASNFAISYIASHQDPAKPKEFGDVHMDVSVDPSLADDVDGALALLHNFWYKRALEAFTAIFEADPQASKAYWGAAMTYNHPFWDPPTTQDLSAAWPLVQKGQKASKKSPREIAAVEALDLAGQPVSVMENHDIGLRRAERRGRRQDKEEQWAGLARARRSPARPYDRRRAIHVRVPR